MAKDNLEQKQHLIDLMNMEKQTAVEWLVDCLNNYDSKMIELFNYEIERAKEIEKQQIIDAYASGYIDGVAQNKITAEQYYKETYKK
jgi:predicted TIM-barrel fold metal-dependent hydrolase